MAQKSEPDMQSSEKWSIHYLLYASNKAVQQEAGTGDEGSSRRTCCKRDFLK